MENKETIILELNKEDLINLVLGVGPYYSLFQDPNIKDKGSYYEPNGWQWDKHKLNECKIHDLYIIYLKCRDSWQK